MQTPLGKMLMPQINQMTDSLNNQSHSVYGGDSVSGPDQPQHSPVETIEGSEEYQMIEPVLDDIYTHFIQNNMSSKFVVLNKIIKNIVRNPDEKKFRSLKRSNQKLIDALYSNESIMTLLFMVGFEEQEEVYY
mmetsp:Transcript_82326/g.177743  ORF Transcript_82326/g.177743 Transcript_82326/m.177743 type:complete len:133 (+) Transcript_82326:381-779(+)